MGVWGVDGSGGVDEKRLKPLGLFCFGGTSNPKDGMLYHVYNEDRSFDVYLKVDDYEIVDVIYKTWKTKNRKEKIDKINERK